MDRDRESGRESRGLPHVAALDGLRGLSVLAVVLYHADVRWMRGGFLGVEVFFVLSGFLMASMLRAEHLRTGTIDVGHFYARRIRRLLPATLGLLVGIVPFAMWLAPDRVHRLHQEIAAVLAHGMNWLLLWNHESYFEAMGRPSPLRHLWSLALEEQFYILLPWLLVVVLGRMRRAVAVTTLVTLAAVSTLWMAALYNPDADPSRVYFGTDTRGCGLLLGAALALVWRDDRFQSRRFEALGGAGLCALLVAFVWVSEVDPLVYRGGFLVIAVLASCVIAGVLDSDSRILGAALRTPLLRYFGLRSFSLYLWHWPVLVVTRAQLDWKLSGGLALCIQLLLSFVLAELSYRCVEDPFRRASLRWSARTLTGVVAVAVLPVLLVLAVTHAADAAGDRVNGPQTSVTTQHVAVRGSDPSASGIDLALHPSSGSASVSPILPAAFVNLSLRPLRVLLVGDSVMRGAAPLLSERKVHVEIEAETGRQVSDAIVLLETRALLHRIPRVVVVHLGNNGTFRDYQFDHMMKVLSAAKTVVFLNTRVSRRWEEPNNSVIAQGVARHPRAMLVDWRSMVAGHPEWFTHDGLHLRRDGALVYGATIRAFYRASDAAAIRRAGISTEQWLSYSGVRQ